MANLGSFSANLNHIRYCHFKFVDVEPGKEPVTSSCEARRHHVSSYARIRGIQTPSPPQVLKAVEGCLEAHSTMVEAGSRFDKAGGGGTLLSLLGPPAGSAAISDPDGDEDKKRLDRFRMEALDAIRPDSPTFISEVMAAIVQSHLAAKAASFKRQAKRGLGAGTGWNRTVKELVERDPFSVDDAKIMVAKALLPSMASLPLIKT